MSDRTRLLNPGPVTLSSRVRQALLRSDLCHREPEFVELQSDVRERLVRVYSETADRYAAVLLTGSGTAAVEAMVGSLIPSAGKGLVVANGIYGERIASMLQKQGRPFRSVNAKWVEPIDLPAARKALDEDPSISHVVTVHHETTTGRLNDLSALGQLCRERGVGLLVDAVSSFGGESIDFAGWNVQGCAGTANKCLHGAPGISFVLIDESAVGKSSSNAPSFYLDLFAHLDAQTRGQPLCTPAVQVLYALQEALEELEELGGWKQRHAKYAALSRQVRAGLRDRGIPLFLPEESCYASMLSSFPLPQALRFEDLHAQAKRSGFVIYAGQQFLKDVMFRVAVMGDLTSADMAEFVDSLTEILD